MFLIVLYSPALVLLPIGFIVGLFVVLFSAGLFLLLGTIYFLAMGILGLIRLSNPRRRFDVGRRPVAVSSASRSARMRAGATPPVVALQPIVNALGAVDELDH
jgi:hypothetical protein